MLVPRPQPFNEVRDAYTSQRSGPLHHLVPRTVGRQAGTPVKVRRTFFFLWRYPMLSIFRRLMKSEQGATALEYTLIASLIAVAAIAAMNSVGGKIQGVLTNVSTAMGT